MNAFRLHFVVKLNNNQNIKRRQRTKITAENIDRLKEFYLQYFLLFLWLKKKQEQTTMYKVSVMRVKRSAIVYEAVNRSGLSKHKT